MKPRKFFMYISVEPPVLFCFGFYLITATPDVNRYSNEYIN